MHIMCTENLVYLWASVSQAECMFCKNNSLVCQDTTTSGRQTVDSQVLSYELLVNKRVLV